MKKAMAAVKSFLKALFSDVPKYMYDCLKILLKNIKNKDFRKAFYIGFNAYLHQYVARDAVVYFFLALEAAILKGNMTAAFLIFSSINMVGGIIVGLIGVKEYLEISKKAEAAPKPKKNPTNVNNLGEMLADAFAKAAAASGMNIKNISVSPVNPNDPKASVPKKEKKVEKKGPEYKLKDNQFSGGGKTFSVELMGGPMDGEVIEVPEQISDTLNKAEESGKIAGATIKVDKVSKDGDTVDSCEYILDVANKKAKYKSR